MSSSRLTIFMWHRLRVYQEETLVHFYTSVKGFGYTQKLAESILALNLSVTTYFHWVTTTSTISQRKLVYFKLPTDKLGKIGSSLTSIQGIKQLSPKWLAVKLECNYTFHFKKIWQDFVMDHTWHFKHVFFFYEKHYFIHEPSCPF